MPRDAVFLTKTFEKGCSAVNDGIDYLLIEEKARMEKVLHDRFDPGMTSRRHDAAAAGAQCDILTSMLPLLLCSEEGGSANAMEIALASI